MEVQRRHIPFFLSSHHLSFQINKKVFFFSFQLWGEKKSMVWSYSLNFFYKHYWKCTSHSHSSSDIHLKLSSRLFCKSQHYSILFYCSQEKISSMWPPTSADSHHAQVVWLSWSHIPITPDSFSGIPAQQLSLAACPLSLLLSSQTPTQIGWGENVTPYLKDFFSHIFDIC